MFPVIFFSFDGRYYQPILLWIYIQLICDTVTRNLDSNGNMFKLSGKISKELTSLQNKGNLSWWKILVIMSLL